MKTQTAIGVIRPEELYRKDELLKRAGLGTTAYNSAVRNGLTVHHKNGRAFVLGRDWIAYVTAGDSSATPQS